LFLILLPDFFKALRNPFSSAPTKDFYRLFNGIFFPPAVPGEQENEGKERKGNQPIKETLVIFGVFKIYQKRLPLKIWLVSTDFISFSALIPRWLMPCDFYAKRLRSIPAHR